MIVCTCAPYLWIRGCTSHSKGHIVVRETTNTTSSQCVSTSSNPDHNFHDIMTAPRLHYIVDYSKQHHYKFNERRQRWRGKSCSKRQTMLPNPNLREKKKLQSPTPAHVCPFLPASKQTYDYQNFLTKQKEH